MAEGTRCVCSRCKGLHWAQIRHLGSAGAGVSGTTRSHANEGHCLSNDDACQFESEPATLFRKPFSPLFSMRADRVAHRKDPTSRSFLLEPPSAASLPSSGCHCRLHCEHSLCTEHLHSLRLCPACGVAVWCTSTSFRSVIDARRMNGGGSPCDDSFCGWNGCWNALLHGRSLHNEKLKW